MKKINGVEMMKKYPFVSVISAVRNEGKYIEDLIKSLKELDYPKNKYEIIISDGLSTDNTKEIVSRYKDVKLLVNEKKLAGAGRNLAIKHSKGKYVAITDGDCIVEKDWLKILVEKIDNSPDNVVAYGGPNLIIESDPPIAKVIGYMQETLLGSGGSPQSYKINEEKEVYSIPNCNIIYKKDVLNKYELFDENFGTGQDGELNYRLTQRGYKFIYTNKAGVWHHRRDSLKVFVKGMYSYGKGMANITKKHKKVIRWYSFIPSLFVLFIILSLLEFFLLNIYYLNILIYLIYILYIITIISTTLIVFVKMNLEFIALLTIILLPIQHISYGLGFIKGLISR